MDFYTKHNETLATEANVQKTLGGEGIDSKWRGREGALWAALHRKYPESIEIVGTDGQATRQNPQKKRETKKKGTKKKKNMQEQEL
jgi:hypothetical protein